MIRIFLLTIILTFPFFNNKTDPEILNAISHKWFAGRKEAGRGINYEIMVVANCNSKRLEFHGLMIDTVLLDLKIMNKGEFTEQFSKGDTLNLYTSLKTDNGNMNFNKGVLKYQIKSKQKDKQILFKEQKELYYK